MDYEIRVEDAQPRQLAVARGGASRSGLSRTILKLLDTAWPMLRAQHAQTGHNVVVYFGGLEHIEAGVELFGDFVDAGDVRHSQTPAGPVVTTAHWASTPRRPARMPRFSGGVRRTDASRPAQAGRSTATGPTTPGSAEPISTCSWRESPDGPALDRPERHRVDDRLHRQHPHRLPAEDLRDADRRARFEHRVGMDVRGPRPDNRPATTTGVGESGLGARGRRHPHDVFRYGRSEFPGFVSRPLFITWGIVIVATSFVIQWLFIAEFGTVGMKAAQYNAFLQNLLMSGLFIAMFVARRGPRGQTLLIATAKWIGTLAPTILFGSINGSLFIIGIGLLCGVFDLAYFGLLIWAKRDPWAFPTTASRLAAT